MQKEDSNTYLVRVSRGGEYKKVTEEQYYWFAKFAGLEDFKGGDFKTDIFEGVINV